MEEIGEVAHGLRKLRVWVVPSQGSQGKTRLCGGTQFVHAAQCVLPGGRYGVTGTLAPS